MLGAVTTSLDAGLAIPDWPTNFGWPPFLLPPGHWIPLGTAPSWEISAAYLHRLAAWMAILLAGLFAGLKWPAVRSWQGKAIALLVPGMLIAQAGLGGLRVLSQTEASAQLLAGMAPLTLGAVWAGTFGLPLLERMSTRGNPGVRFSTGLAAALLALWIYGQVVFGIQLRHVSPAGSPFWFYFWVWVHVLSGLGLAGVAALLIGQVSGQSWEKQRARCRSRVALLGSALLVQVVLGAATWLALYGVPRWFSGWIANWQLALEGGSLLPVTLTSVHAFLGLTAVVLGVAVWGISVCEKDGSADRDWAVVIVDELKELPFTAVMAAWGAFLVGVAAAFPRHIPLAVVVWGSLATILWSFGLLTIAAHLRPVAGTGPSVRKASVQGGYRILWSVGGALCFLAGLALLGALATGSLFFVAVLGVITLLGCVFDTSANAAKRRQILLVIAGILAGGLVSFPRNLLALGISLVLLVLWYEAYRQSLSALGEKWASAAESVEETAGKPRRGLRPVLWAISVAGFSVAALFVALGTGPFRLGAILLGLSAISWPLVSGMTWARWGIRPQSPIRSALAAHGILTHGGLILTYLHV